MTPSAPMKDGGVIPLRESPLTMRLPDRAHAVTSAGRAIRGSMSG